MPTTLQYKRKTRRASGVEARTRVSVLTDVPAAASVARRSTTIAIACPSAAPAHASADATGTKP